ncbi:MAG: hypothetical protein JWL66_784 [Sphingomonadales bacterium]|nr:hypothetical protein [Sphingomonadales bacterium]
MFISLLLALASEMSTAVAAPRQWPAGIRLPDGNPVDEDYRHQFALCDKKRQFRNRRPKYGCGDDPNAVEALRRLPDGAIAFVSKLAVDLDGSSYACSPLRGRSDQCPTSLMLPDGKGGSVPVDAERIPYVVIPYAGPRELQGEFSERTGIQVGDFGVVLAQGHVVPVIVADTGPYAKLGEGSLALHEKLGRQLCAEHDLTGACRQVVDDMESITGNVTTVLFPHSARADLTPATIGRVVREEGMRLWREAQVRWQANG